MKRRIRAYSLLILYTSCLFSVLGLFSDWHLVFDLMSHFKLQYAISGIVCFVVLIMFKAYANAGLSLALIFFNSLYLFPWYIDGGLQTQANNHGVKIFMNNVLTSNSSAELLIEQIKDANPDVVLLLETNQKWVTKLAEIEKEFRYSVIEDREDNFGIVLYSKLPIESNAIRYYGGSPVPSIFAELKSGNGSFTFIGTHPLPPINQQYYHFRNKQLQALAQEASLSTSPLVIAGDLNTTMWSNHYKTLETVGGLRNARSGQGIGSTWPSLFSWLGIPIDHVLVSEHFMVQSFKVGQSTGSDHRPVSVNLILER